MNDMNSTNISKNSGIINDLHRGNKDIVGSTLKGGLGIEGSSSDGKKVKNLFIRSGNGSGGIKNLPK